MTCCNRYGKCQRGCTCPAREAGLITPLRRPRSVWVDKLITGGLYAVSLAALICVAMLIGAVIGGAV